MILRILATARYLHLNAQELHDALIDAHTTIGDALEEKIRLRDQGPDTKAALLTDPLAAISTKHQQARADATFNEEHAGTAEWDANRLRGQLGLAQQDLIRARNAHTAALAQAHAQAADLDDRLKASVAAERKASALSNQKETSLVELAARLQQQLASSRENDYRIRESLRQCRWTEAQIHSLMFPSSPSSSSAVPGGNASSSFSSRPAAMSPGDGNTSAMYAGSYDNSAGGSLIASRGSSVRPFTPSEPGNGLRAFADNASVTHSTQSHLSPSMLRLYVSRARV